MRDKSYYAIFTCDAWKSHSSMRLSMVCTSKSKVIKQVNKIILER